MIFSCLLKRYDPNLQNDAELETTSCFIAEKIALDEPLCCTGSLWKAFKWCESRWDQGICSCECLVRYDFQNLLKMLA